MITIDAITGITKTASSTTHTLSHTVGASATYLLVPVADWSGDNVTGVTYNGVAMSQLVKETRNPNPGSLQIYWYGLASPAVGTHDIVVTRSTTSAWLNSAGISLIGASSSVDATTAQTGSAGQTSALISHTTVADNSAVFVFALGDNGNIAASTNLTEIASDVADDASIVCRSTTFPKTPAGAESYTVTFNSNSGHALVAVSVGPGVAQNTTNFFQVI